MWAFFLEWKLTAVLVYGYLLMQSNACLPVRPDCLHPLPVKLNISISTT